MKSKIAIICAFITFMSCNKSEKKYQYHPNGRLRVSAEIKDGLVDGILESYDSNGVLQLKSNYCKGFREGKTNEYYHSGALEAEAYFSKGKLDSGYTYYESSELSSKKYFDQNEYLEKIELFDKSGVRDSSEYIYVNIKKIEDERYCFIWRLLNVIPDDVKNSDSGEMIITSGFNSKNIVKFYDYYVDTIDIVKPTQKTHFRYDFNRQKIKGDSLFGAIYFKTFGKDTGELKIYLVGAKILD